MLENYENAVIAVNKGDTSEEAVSKVLNTFETARQSLISYYKAMITFAELNQNVKCVAIPEVYDEFTTPSGEIIVAFGEYGYDG